MEQVMEKIEIKNFITINILELNKEEYVYFVYDFNEKYFYLSGTSELCTYQQSDVYTDLHFMRATQIYKKDLDKLEKNVYELHRQLTFKIDRVDYGQEYYYITSKFEVDSMIEYNERLDDYYYNSFNYFLSEEEAEHYIKKIQQYLIKLRKEEYWNE